MGYSERLARPRVLEQRVDDLGRLTDALGITGPGRDGPVVTVAHDWGGIVSLGWAADHRDQLRGIVLTNTAVHQPEPGKGPILIRLAHQPLINLLACRVDAAVRPDHHLAHLAAVAAGRPGRLRSPVRLRRDARRHR